MKTLGSTYHFSRKHECCAQELLGSGLDQAWSKIGVKDLGLDQAWSKIGVLRFRFGSNKI